MVQNGPNGRKWSKMVKNGGRDLKRAQRTGRRAPRLLVPSYFSVFVGCLV